MDFGTGQFWQGSRKSTGGEEEGRGLMATTISRWPAKCKESKERLKVAAISPLLLFSRCADAISLHT